MKLFIMGDIHGVWGNANDSYDDFRGRFKLDCDALIQVGDYGYYPKNGKNLLGDCDPYHYPKESGLWERKFDHKAIFIDGNHENHEALREATSQNPILNFGWEHAHRGWCKDGILCIGGASSVDKEYRLRWGHHWSDLEDLTREEVDPILEANHEDVKVVISHTCPSSFDMSAAAKPAFGGENKEEINRVLLQEVLEKYRPARWYFGHWHKAMTGEYVHKDGSVTKWQCLGICELTYLDTELL